MTDKFIIHDETLLPSDVVLRYVTAVVEEGKVSSTRGVVHYCHVTKFEQVTVCCTMNSENSFTFRVMERC